MKEITEQDVTFETTRSGGPGGQHVNRRSTAVRLRAQIEDLPLTDREKDFVREYLPPKNRVKGGGLIVENAGSRSQQENRRRALKVANEELRKAIEKGRQAKKEKQRKKRISRGKTGGGGGGSEEDIHEKRKQQYRSETTDDLLEQAYEEDPETIERYLNENPREQDGDEDV